jgi:hypothetical protein
MSAPDEGYLLGIAANQEVFRFDAMDVRVAASARHRTAGARAGLSGRRGSIASVLVNYADATVKEFRWR